MTNSSLKNECYTPSYFVDPIRDFAKGFDFDPFSSDLANKTIKARDYCDITDSAYSERSYLAWLNSKTIWCNPPYSTKECIKAISHLLGYRANKEIYLLLNTDNSTRAYNLALQHCTAILLVRKRIKFIRPYAESSTNNRPQTLFFFGSIDRAKEFKESLTDLGKVFINYDY